MDRIWLVIYACIALGFVLTCIGVSRERRSAKMPCTFCGKLLSPPLYACKHRLGDGRGATDYPSSIRSGKFDPEYTERSN